MSNDKNRTILLILAAFLSVGGATLGGLGFFVFSNSYADVGGIALLIAGLSIFFTDTLA